MSPDEYATKIAAHNDAVDHHLDRASELLDHDETDRAECHNDAAEAHVRARDAWRNSALGGKAAGVAPYFASQAWQLSFKAHTADDTTRPLRTRHVHIVR